MRPETMIQAVEAGTEKPHEAPVGEGPSEAPAAPQSQLVLADLLVEDVSIDGMCGVY